jgi:hypothetical protein
VSPTRAEIRRNRWIAAGGVVLVIAIVAVVIALVADGDGSDDAKEAVPTAPLTGLPDPDGVANGRAAITVKVNNTADNTQAGVDQADVVYEEVVEGQYTRLAAIFNSHAPDKVGPVRSVRRTDASIVWPIGGVFVFSGGAQASLDAINEAPVIQLDETRAGSMMFRDDSAVAPFNLWARVNQMFANEKDAEPVPPPALFTYRADGAPLVGTPVTSVRVGFNAGFDVTWSWNTDQRVWTRTVGSMAASPTQGNGTTVAPKNVIVMKVNYAGGVGVEGSEAELTGSGDALVFTAGREIQARWERADEEDVATFVDADGNEIALTPGQTWVQLADVSYAVDVTAAS